MLKVKIFDCEHEEDLEEELNSFLETLDESNVRDVKYHVAAIGEAVSEQVYCFSAMIVYSV